MDEAEGGNLPTLFVYWPLQQGNFCSAVVSKVLNPALRSRCLGSVVELWFDFPIICNKSSGSPDDSHLFPALYTTNTACQAAQMQSMQMQSMRMQQMERTHQQQLQEMQFMEQQRQFWVEGLSPACPHARNFSESSFWSLKQDRSFFGCPHFALRSETR